MNRRDIIKAAGVAGVGLLVPGWVARAVPTDASVFLITDRPQRDLERIQRTRVFRHSEPHARVRPMAPSGQDLSILTSSGLLDPVRERGTWNEFRHLALELRARREPGRFLLELETIPANAEHVVEFQVEGVTVERIALTNDYREIPIAGSQGETVFRLEAGALSVVRSSCRHKLCEKRGPVRSGRVICAPNRLVAVVGGGMSNVDAITG